jgi:hypothetical protein
VRASGPVCTGAENLAPTGVRTLNRGSESLYRLRSPNHLSCLSTFAIDFKFNTFGIQNVYYIYVRNMYNIKYTSVFVSNKSSP